MRTPYDFSSMTALICFESAARHMSFKQAAKEMNVTPAAISHHIKALENDLGCPLFYRINRGVELSEKGALLFVEIRRSFETVSNAILNIRNRLEAIDVTIQSTLSVSSLWLTSKIAAFWKNHPDITITQIVGEGINRLANCDLQVYYGVPYEKGAEYHELYRDHIVVLGTRHFARENRIKKIEDLLVAPLVHVSNNENIWTNFNEWFQSFGLVLPKGRSYNVNNHTIALQAAQDDVGAVLGWTGLVTDLMQEKKLIQLVPETILSSVPFLLKINDQASEKARLFAKWLMENL